MSSPYSCSGLVLSKTKLGETDLIVTLMDTGGTQIRAVAKGARKPSSSFSSRLELLSEVDLLLAQGKSLDIVKEARLVDAHAALRTSMERFAAASVCLELLKRCTQENLTVDRLYPLSHATFHVMEKSSEGKAPALTAAFLLKAVAMMGFSPMLRTCVRCGKPIDNAGATTSLSFVEGGCLCDGCGPDATSMMIDFATVEWLRYLLASTMAQIGSSEITTETSFACLHFSKSWLHDVVGEHLKSLDYLLTCGLY